MNFALIGAPVVIGLAFVAVMSCVRSPDRRLRLNAMVAVGASGIYLSGGAFGPWELAACAVIFVCAYRGRRSWNWIGAAWLLHTALDIAHVVKGVDLLPWAPHSSLGCAICDPVIALWCFGGGRPIDQLIRSLTRSSRTRLGGRRRARPAPTAIVSAPPTPGSV